MKQQTLVNAETGIFAHSKIGKNREPASKLSEFIEIVEKGAGTGADILFMKFCYVDIIEENRCKETIH